ncbi:hypothetical protein D0962_19490 [Leptolyngbyaceae cyanobacterium CCMR0082]|uniref:IPT/TIG domain-containing protein n=1 Tax=Adonisia turfae CCMR0082 TaxID=2304604 RepID=A0A6M0SA42_9CYAN|nr:hypothetical protein [Adonisia turfae]NEZ64943.1 hypothetical protein [Adonisia turfae CCMR0082]
MATKGNKSWNLESFLDSLILELDKAQDTLSVKGLNRRLTYMVQDMNLELQLFPEFDGDNVRFTTAKPGEKGASKISFQLGSISDSQIREVTRPPIQHGETSIDEVDIPDHERKELKKLGIQSTEDLRRTVEDRNVDLGKVTKKKVSYSSLANLINQARRQEHPPSVAKASLSKAQGNTVLTLEGNNLASAQSLDQFPAAVINDQPVEILSANNKQLKIKVNQTHLTGHDNQLKVALDPYAVFTMNLES